MSLVKIIASYDNPSSIGSRLRTKRIRPLLKIIDDIFERNGSVNLLDIGGRKAYWEILPSGFLEQKNVYITILNLPTSTVQKDEKRFRFLDGDACDLSDIPDYSYDIVHSNSVIEHVGDWARMQQYANEVKRLAKIYFVQTPYFWFPIEPHCLTLFFHWLPLPVRVSLVMKFSLGNWQRAKDIKRAVSTVESARLLDIKMFRGLFGEAEIIIERLFFFPKSLIAVKAE